MTCLGLDFITSAASGPRRVCLIF